MRWLSAAAVRGLCELDQLVVEHACTIANLDGLAGGVGDAHTARIRDAHTARLYIIRGGRCLWVVHVVVGAGPANAGTARWANVFC